MVSENKILIQESIDNNELINAIKNKQLINIYYDAEDGNPDGKGWRRIEPFVLGKNKYGNDVLRAWQQHGVSASYPPGKDGSNGGKIDPLTYIPGWRMFRVTKIVNINTTGFDKFTNPRPKYNPKDKDMVQIYAAAQFGDNSSNQNTNVQPIKPTPQIINKPVVKPISVPKIQPKIVKPIVNKPLQPQIQKPMVKPIIPQKQIQPQQKTITQPKIVNPQKGLKQILPIPKTPIQAKKQSVFDKLSDKFKRLINYKK